MGMYGVPLLSLSLHGAGVYVHLNKRLMRMPGGKLWLSVFSLVHEVERHDSKDISLSSSLLFSSLLFFLVSWEVIVIVSSLEEERRWRVSLSRTTVLLLDVYVRVSLCLHGGRCVWVLLDSLSRERDPAIVLFIIQNTSGQLSSPFLHANDNLMKALFSRHSSLSATCVTPSI